MTYSQHCGRLFSVSDDGCLLINDLNQQKIISEFGGGNLSMGVVEEYGGGMAGVNTCATCIGAS